jgi:hypothetical protein
MMSDDIDNHKTFGGTGFQPVLYLSTIYHLKMRSLKWLCLN